MTPRFKSSLQWGLGILLALTCFAWYGCIMVHEGPWVPDKFGLFRKDIWKGVAAIFLVALGAISFGFLYRSSSRKWMPYIGILAYAICMGWLFGNSELLSQLRQNPDFFLILLLVLAFSLFGVLYRAIAKTGPLWPILLVPAVIALSSAYITGNMGMVSGILLLGFSFSAIGGTVLSWARLDNTEIKPIKAAVGMACVIMLFRIIGPLGGAGPGIIVSVMAGLSLLSARVFLEDARSLRSWLLARRDFDFYEWALIGLGAALALIYWLNVTTPEIGPDAIGGRAALPMLWARDGVIKPMPEMFLSYMGIGGEILNLVFYPFAGECVAKCSTYLSGVLLVLLIMSAGTTRNRWAAMTATTLFFTSTLLTWQFVHGFVDLHVAMFSLAAIYCYDRWYNKGSDLWLLVSGILVGTSVSVKLNAGAVLAILGLLTLVGPRSPSLSIKERMKLLVLFSIGAAVTFIPSVLRSLWLTGNPIFPFANGVFQSPLAELKLKAFLYGSTVNLSSLLLPFKMILEPMKYAELGTFHPFFLGFSIVALLGLFKTRGEGKMIWIICCIIWLAWLFTEQNARYAIPALAITAYAMTRMPSNEESPIRLPHWAIYTLIIAGFAINLARPSGWLWCQEHRGRPGFAHKYLRGEETAEEYKVWYLPIFRLAQIVNQTYGSKSIVWEVPVVRDHLSFHGRTISYPHAAVSVLKPFDSILPLHSLASDRDACQKVLAEQGVTHVVWDENSPYIYHWPESKWASIFNIDFSERNLKLLAASGTLRLYQVLSTPTTPSYKTEIINPKKWDPVYTVSPGELIGLRMDWEKKLPDGCYIDMVWYSNDERLLWFERLYFPFDAPIGWHRHWQTTPPGASTLKIFVSEGCWMAKPKILRSVSK